MDPKILNPDIQAFINKNIGQSISKLALQKNPFPEVDWISILNQIEAKTKSKDKLPLYNYIGKPSEKYFPFNYIKVITKNDTLIIDNKNLLKNINKKQKGNDYFIELN